MLASDGVGPQDLDAYPKLQEVIPDNVLDNPILPRQDRAPGDELPRQDETKSKKTDGNRQWKYAYPKPLKEEGVQWRRSGNTGWARWAMTYYTRPDGKKAQRRRYIGYMGDAALNKVYKMAGSA